jgi:hypothetical protein
MSLRRHLPRIVLAAAAAATIATSPATNPWFLGAGESLEPFALDDVEPTRVLAIEAVVGTGEQAAFGTDGGVRVTLELSARDVTGVRPAEVEVELRSEDRAAERDRQIVTVVPGGRTSVALELPAWLECEARTCTEDFTVTLRRVPAEEDPIVDVTGLVRVDFSAEGPAEPPDADLLLDVTDLGPVP